MADTFGGDILMSLRKVEYQWRHSVATESSPKVTTTSVATENIVSAATSVATNTIFCGDKIVATNTHFGGDKMSRLIHVFAATSCRCGYGFVAADIIFSGDFSRHRYIFQLHPHIAADTCF